MGDTCLAWTGDAERMSEWKKEKSRADKKVKGIKRGLCKLTVMIFVFSIHIAVCLAPAHVNNQHCA